MSLNESAIDRLTDLLGGDPRLLAACLLGSALTDRFRPDSDVDVALMVRPGATLSALDRLDLAARLQTAVGYPVQLGLLTHGDLIYAKEAVEGGRWLFCHDVPARDLFVATALALYVQLRYERREVERAYAAG